jgi:hypothetical protein
MQIIISKQECCTVLPLFGRGASTAYVPKAAFKFAYGSVVVIWRTGVDLAIRKARILILVLLILPCATLPLRATRPRCHRQLAVVVLAWKMTGSWEDGSEEVPGSIGPGPARR